MLALDHISDIYQQVRYTPNSFENWLEADIRSIGSNESGYEMQNQHHTVFCKSSTPHIGLQ